tara:strand:- start:44 stop:454 length:411 start_codon:yes stop_codon:yes gene_type:complete
MSAFQLHDQLAKDSFFVRKLGVSQVRLNNDSRFPWLILIPELPNLRELHEIPDNLQTSVYKEIHLCSKLLEELTKADKMNVAALGNLVPQLHIHVIARKHHDIAWPQPVWTKEAAVPFKKDEQEKLVGELLKRLEQ